jgi:hypothetical protein
VIRRKLVDDKGKISTVNALLGSSAAGVVAASMSTPLDVIKTRLQVRDRELWQGGGGV